MVPLVALPMCFLSYQRIKTRVLLQQFAGLEAVCLVFSRQSLFSGGNISFYFLLFPPWSVLYLVGRSFSAGRCLHEKGGFAEGCADVNVSVLLQSGSDMPVKGRARCLGRCGSNSANVSWAMPKQKQCKGVADEAPWEQAEELGYNTLAERWRLHFSSCDWQAYLHLYHPYNGCWPLHSINGVSVDKSCLSLLPRQSVQEKQGSFINFCLVVSKRINIAWSWWQSVLWTQKPVG